jgi:hypothetical protein
MYGWCATLISSTFSLPHCGRLPPLTAATVATFPSAISSTGSTVAVRNLPNQPLVTNTLRVHVGRAPRDAACSDVSAPSTHTSHTHAHAAVLPAASGFHGFHDSMSPWLKTATAFALRRSMHGLTIGTTAPTASLAFHELGATMARAPPLFAAATGIAALGQYSGFPACAAP